jgi:Protein of unknown function (DUF962)
MAREGGLIAWQWQGYADNHRGRFNLLLHLVAVPAFIAGILAFVRLLIAGHWLAAGIPLLLAVVAFGVQGLGHSREAMAPVPFDGPLDFLGRVFVEQFITFPRFVLSGQFARNFAHG